MRSRINYPTRARETTVINSPQSERLSPDQAIGHFLNLFKEMRMGLVCLQNELNNVIGALNSLDRNTFERINLKRIITEAKRLKSLIEEMSMIEIKIGFDQANERDGIKSFINDLCEKHGADKAMVYFGNGGCGGVSYFHGFSELEEELYHNNQRIIEALLIGDANRLGVSERKKGKAAIKKLGINSVEKIMTMDVFDEWHLFIDIYLYKKSGSYSEEEKEEIKNSIRARGDKLKELNRKLYERAGAAVTEMHRARHDCRIKKLDFDSLLEIDRIDADQALKKMNEISRLLPNTIDLMSAWLNSHQKSEDGEMMDIVPVLERVIENYQGVISERNGLRLEVKIDSPRTVCKCDRNILQIILGNLMDNAIKYTPSGKITVRHYTEYPVPSLMRGMAFIEVKDTGIGIPPEEVGKIYDIHRAANVGSIEGTGIGLNSVRSHITRMNGGIRVASQLGGGSTFRINLPME